MDCVVASGINFATKLYAITLTTIILTIIALIVRMTRVLYGGRFWAGEMMKVVFMMVIFRPCDIYFRPSIP